MQTALQLLRGPVDEPVTFTVRPAPGEPPREVTLTRKALPGTQPVEVRLLPGSGGIGHLRVLTFSPGVTRKVRTAVSGLRASGLRALVLDLRDNGGGLLQEGMAMADLFLAEGTVTVVEGREPYPSRAFSRRIQTATPGNVGDFPMAVLVNGGTASAAEVLAAALRDNGRAVLVGSRTFGKGRIQEAMPLGEEAGAVRVTVGRYLTPSGEDIQGAGLRPDVRVELEEEERFALYRAQAEAWYHDGRVPEDAPEERQLDRAVDLLQTALRQNVPPAERLPDTPHESAETSDEPARTEDERPRTDLERPRTGPETPAPEGSE
jgi:carboxyl-terminal processing protease